MRDPAKPEKLKGEARQFSTFVVVGAFAAGVNWTARIGFSAMGLSLTMAVVLAYLCGMATAYILSRYFVFERTGNAVHGEIMRFVLVNLVAVAQVWLVTVGLDRWLFPRLGFNWYPAAVAHAIGVASPIVSSYFGHRFFTFKKALGEPVDAGLQAGGDSETANDVPKSVIR